MDGIKINNSLFYDDQINQKVKERPKPTIYYFRIFNPL